MFEKSLPQIARTFCILDKPLLQIAETHCIFDEPLLQIAGALCISAQPCRKLQGDFYILRQLAEEKRRESPIFLFSFQFLHIKYYLRKLKRKKTFNLLASGGLK